MRLTLRNSFHRSECRVLAPEGVSEREFFECLQAEAYGGDQNAARKVRSIWERLCGIHGCKCGTVRM